MPCALTRSEIFDCRDSVGGIIEFKVKVMPSSATLASNYTLTSGVVTIASGSQTGWYSYEVEKETSSFSETATGDEQNGTIFYSQELKIIVNKLRANMRNELKLLGQNRLQIVIKDKNKNYWLAGYEFGCTLSTSSNTSGTAAGDRSGYEMTFIAKEIEPHVNLSAATYATLVTA